MFKYEKHNLVMKLPSMIKSMAKANDVIIPESTIEVIVNQVKYYTDNYTKGFPLDKNNPWIVDIKPIPNDAFDKYGIPCMNDYTVNITLFRDRSKKQYIDRELIFYSKDGKLLAIYHYRPEIVITKLFNDRFSKKIYTVPQNTIEKIKEHMNDN